MSPELRVEYRMPVCGCMLRHAVVHSSDGTIDAFMSAARLWLQAAIARHRCPVTHV